MFNAKGAKRIQSLLMAQVCLFLKIVKSDREFKKKSSKSNNLYGKLVYSKKFFLVLINFFLS